MVEPEIAFGDICIEGIPLITRFKTIKDYSGKAFYSQY